MINPDFVGDQTPKFFDEHTSVYFAEKAGIYRIPLTVAKRYKNLEDILSDVGLIPIEYTYYTIDEMKRQVASDINREFPRFFPEYSVLAHAGKSTLERPIALIRHPDGDFYVPTKEIHKYIRRIPVDTNTQETV
jgi:hypothetical protein